MDGDVQQHYLAAEQAYSEGDFDQAEAIMPGHPAIPLARGKALAQVWRWEQAATAFEEATRRAPNDDRTWRGLANALGSLGKREEGLKAAQRGLKLEPRDAHLLRSQSLAYTKLDPDGPKAKLAHETWLKFRRDEKSSSIKGQCKDPDSDCQRERVPIPTRELKSVAAKDTPPAP